MAEGDSKSFRFPQELYCKLSVLAEDVSKLVDLAPNSQQKEVHAVLRERLAVQVQRFKELMDQGLPAFNNLLDENGIPGIFIPKVN